MKAQAQPRRIVLGREGKKYLLIMYSFFFFFLHFPEIVVALPL